MMKKRERKGQLAAHWEAILAFAVAAVVLIIMVLWMSKDANSAGKSLIERILGMFRLRGPD